MVQEERGEQREKEEVGQLTHRVVAPSDPHCLYLYP